MAFVYIYIALAMLATLFVLAACMLSSRIQQTEEARRLPPPQPVQTQTEPWGLPPTQRPIY